MLTEGYPVNQDARGHLVTKQTKERNALPVVLQGVKCRNCLYQHTAVTKPSEE
jgi:hypothetical protein